MEFQNKTSWELEGRGYAYNEFWIPKRPQKKPQNTNSLGLQKGGLNHHGFLDFIKNTKKSRNETVDRELEGKAWRSLGTNVLYSIHCTVQYHDGAFKENRVDFSAVDNDIGRSLMIDVPNIEIHGNNCTREARLTDTGSGSLDGPDVLKIEAGNNGSQTSSPPGRTRLTSLLWSSGLTWMAA